MKQALLIITLVFSGKLLAYPIDPLSLKNLIETSDLIVYGAVDDPKVWNRVSSKNYKVRNGDTIRAYIRGWSGDGIVEITPSKIYKGPKEYSLIKIRNLQGITCPAPAYYKDKGFAIAFLRQTKDSLWITNGLRYGSKNMETIEEYQIYNSLIESYLDILELEEGSERTKAVQEWLVKCCESRYTVWDGAIEFNTKGPYASYYREYQKSKFDNNLSELQIQRLEKSFLESDSISKGTMLLANTLLKYSSKDVVRQKLIQGFEYSDKYDRKDLALFINKISNSSELNAMGENIEKSYYFRKDSRLEEYLDSFINIAREVYPIR